LEIRVENAAMHPLLPCYWASLTRYRAADQDLRSRCLGEWGPLHVLLPRPQRADEASGIYRALHRGNARSAAFKKVTDDDACERILAEGLKLCSGPLPQRSVDARSDYFKKGSNPLETPHNPNEMAGSERVRPLLETVSNTGILCCIPSCSIRSRCPARARP
jgi:hypothetical protein